MLVAGPRKTRKYSGSGGAEEVTVGHCGSRDNRGKWVQQVLDSLNIVS